MMVGWWVSFWDCLFLGAMLNFRGVKFLMGIILIPQTFKKHVVFRVFFQKIPLVKMDEKTPGCFERMNWAMKKSQLRVYRGWYYTVIWGIKMKYIRIYIYIGSLVNNQYSMPRAPALSFAFFRWLQGPLWTQDGGQLPFQVGGLVLLVAWIGGFRISKLAGLSGCWLLERLLRIDQMIEIEKDTWDVMIDIFIR